MAKPIGETPTLYEKDAVVVLKRMKEPPTEKQKELAQKIKNLAFARSGFCMKGDFIFCCWLK